MLQLLGLIIMCSPLAYLTWFAHEHRGFWSAVAVVVYGTIATMIIATGTIMWAL